MKDRPSIMNVTKTSLEHLHTDLRLYQEIFTLVAPSYIDPTALLQRDIADCDTLYLARDENQSLCAFFMVGQHAITVHNQSIMVFFLGLSATSTQTKDTGIVRLLYQALINDVQQVEQSNHRRIPLWHTTATPSVFHAVNLLFADNEPNNFGQYSDVGKQLALAIRAYKDWDYQPNTHPFVLKNVALNTRYSSEECRRIESICQKKQFTLFEDLGIQESEGDRLLRISYTPSHKVEQRIYGNP